MADSIDITPLEVCAIHSAAMTYRDIAARRAVRMPSSSAAFLKSAERLEALRDKLVPFLLPHEQIAYPQSRARLD